MERISTLFGYLVLLHPRMNLTQICVLFIKKIKKSKPTPFQQSNILRVMLTGAPGALINKERKQLV